MFFWKVMRKVGCLGRMWCYGGGKGVIGVIFDVMVVLCITPIVVRVL